MSKRYDNSIGKILIDIDAANEDNGRAEKAIEELEKANEKMQLMFNNSQDVFAGRTGERFRASLNALMILNKKEIDNITSIKDQIVAMVNKYMDADRELAERWRRFSLW